MSLEAAPVFVALTREGLATAERARAALGGEVHVSASLLPGTRMFPGSFLEMPKSGTPDFEWEKVPVGLVRLAEEGEAEERPPQPSAGHPLTRPSDKSEGHPLPQGERVGAGRLPPVHFTDTTQHLRALFAEGRPIVGICAAGILIRILAPLLSDKRGEPPVVALSEDGGFVVPLLGGHCGANDLARRLAKTLGGHAAITTAGDSRFGVALDAPPTGWTLANPDHAKRVMAALLAGASAQLEGEAAWLAESDIPFAADGAVRLIATTAALTSPLWGGRSSQGNAAANFGRGDAEAAQRPPPEIRAHLASLDASNFDLPSRGRLGGLPGDDDANLTLVYHPRRLAVGLGCERGADPAEAIDLVRRSLAEAGYAEAAIALVASLDLKADEAAVLDAAVALGAPARFFSAAALEAETPRLKHPSEAVFREVGCHGVAEGAALAAAGPQARLVVAKTKSARVTCAVAEAPEIIDAGVVGRARGRLAVVGIGPGAAEWLTPEARQLLQSSDAAIGYSLYLDLVAPLIAHAERFESALGSEEARVRHALSLAAEGRNVALISSGDPGVYALAALVFECLDADATFSQREKVVAERPDEGMRHSEESRNPSPVGFADTLSLWERVKRVEIVVAPGVSAMQAAAARAGAPLGHDFCAISLSDLLTPWETIEARIRAAAEGDFVVAFYNPVSERRRTQLAEAKRILLAHRSPETPVVLAKNLGREGETVLTVALADLSIDNVDMLTVVIVGASTTRQVTTAGWTWTYTPRGYEKKRSADAAE